MCRVLKALKKAYRGLALLCPLLNILDQSVDFLVPK